MGINQNTIETYEKSLTNRVRNAFDSFLVLDLNSKKMIERRDLYFEPDNGKEGRIKEIVLDTTAESIDMASVYYRGRRPGNYKIRLMN